MRFDERPRLLFFPELEFRPPLPLSFSDERPLLRLREREPPPLRDWLDLFDVGMCYSLVKRRTCMLSGFEALSPC
jgi:hypothetical protein